MRGAMVFGAGPCGYRLSSRVRSLDFEVVWEWLLRVGSPIHHALVRGTSSSPAARSYFVFDEGYSQSHE